MSSYTKHLVLQGYHPPSRKDEDTNSKRLLQGRPRVKKTLFLACLSISLLIIGVDHHVPAVDAAGAEVESLKAAHQRYLQAWSAWDIDTIVEIGTGAAGFGHSTAFPRPIRERDSFRTGVKSFYDTMDVFTIRILTENYNVVGTTGAAWGHYACTTKQKEGPRRTIYLRYAHTFAKVNGKWQLVLYHRSFITGEDMQ